MPDPKKKDREIEVLWTQAARSVLGEHAACVRGRDGGRLTYNLYRRKALLGWGKTWAEAVDNAAARGAIRKEDAEAIVNAAGVAMGKQGCEGGGAK